MTQTGNSSSAQEVKTGVLTAHLGKKCFYSLKMSLILKDTNYSRQSLFDFAILSRLSGWKFEKLFVLKLN